MKQFAAIVLGNYLLRTFVAAGLALPFVEVVAAAGITRFPGGDRLLFEPSGLYLLELLRLAGPEFVALARGSLLLLLPLTCALLVARAVSLVALTDGPGPLGVLLARALPLVPAFLAIAGLTALAQVLTLGGFVWVGAQLEGAFTAGSERRADLAFALVALLGVLASLLLGALAELARASAAQERSGALRSLSRALELARSHPRRLLSRWASLGMLGLALVLVAARVTEHVDVGRAGAWRVALVFALHQLVVLTLVALHTAWLKTAVSVAQEPIASR
jgi:hypothetical protein